MLINIHPPKHTQVTDVDNLLYAFIHKSTQDINFAEIQSF